jgi:hypothetical protein
MLLQFRNYKPKIYALWSYFLTDIQIKINHGGEDCKVADRIELALGGYK